MSRLVFKDIIIQKRYFLFSFFYILFMASLLRSNFMILSALLYACTYALITTACSIEDKNNTHRVLCSLPITKKALVLSKYLSGFVYFIWATIAYESIYLLYKVLPFGLSLGPVTPENLLAGFVACSLFTAIFYPLYFKFGYTKSRFFITFMALVPFFTLFYLPLIFKMQTISPAWIQNIISFLAARSPIEIGVATLFSMILVNWISYILSVRFYNRRIV